MFMACCCLFSTSAMSQKLALTDLELVGGKCYSSFLFKNSVGEKDQLLDYTALNNFGARLNFAADKHTLRSELLFHQGGAVSDFNGIPLSWKLNYVNLNLAYSYRIISSKRFSVAPGIGFGAGYLLNGEQYIGNVRYSIQQTQSLKAFDIGFHTFCAARMALTDALFLSLEYRFGISIGSIENDAQPEQTRNIYHAAQLGIGYTFNNSNNENHE